MDTIGAYFGFTSVKVWNSQATIITCIFLLIWKRFKSAEDPLFGCWWKDQVKACLVEDDLMVVLHWLRVGGLQSAAEKDIEESTRYQKWVE